MLCLHRNMANHQHTASSQSGGGQLFHEPWWIVERTTGILSTTALSIPERIIGVEYMLVSTFAGSITQVVTPHIGWYWERDWVVHVDAGTKDRL